MSGILRPPCRECGRLYGHLDGCAVIEVNAQIQYLMSLYGVEHVRNLLTRQVPDPEITKLANDIALEDVCILLDSEAIKEEEDGVEWLNMEHSWSGESIDPALRYLELRGKLIRHPYKPRWIRISDVDALYGWDECWNRFLHEISAKKLVERAVRIARDKSYRKGQKHPRWVGVVDAFALGSTYARDLCRKFGLDPDEEVAR